MLLTCKDQIIQWKEGRIEVKAGGGTGDSKLHLEQWIKENYIEKLGAGDYGVSSERQE